jgi:hypothetical protein
MRRFALFFLTLTALHAPHGHHAMPSNWQMRAHDGNSASDFGRRFRQKDEAELPREQMRLDRFDMGNGAQVGVGLVHGRHVGFRFKLPF